MSDSCGTFRDPAAKQLSQGRQKAFFFAWRFCLFCAMGMGFFYLAPVGVLLQPLLTALAALVGGLLKVTGLSVIVLGQKVVLPRVFGIDIATECSGAQQLILFLSAVLAYPTSNRSRLFGVALGTAAVLLGNLVRLVTLFWVGVQAREYFDVAHSYIWGGVSCAGLVLLWLLWLRLSALPGSLCRLAGDQTLELRE